jgi:hypothetical protein
MAVIVSPVYRLDLHDILIVQTSLGRQAFYRSTGMNSNNRGKWYPFDEILAATGWVNKTAYTTGPGLEEGQPLHRLGNVEFAQISEELTAMNIPRGVPVPAGREEIAAVTLNRILDFFGCRRASNAFSRPVPE